MFQDIEPKAANYKRYIPRAAPNPDRIMADWFKLALRVRRAGDFKMPKGNGYLTHYDLEALKNGN